MINKKYLFLIQLLSMSIACSAGTNSTAGKPGNYSFNNLIMRNSFYTPPTYGRCPGIPQRAIDQNPNLSIPLPICAPDNNLSTQIAYGCSINPTLPNSLGAKLARSVVGIALYKNGSWTFKGSGTLIESQWVLIPASFVANSSNNPGSRGSFNTNTDSLFVLLPTPDGFISDENGIRAVAAMVIPNRFNYFDEPYNPPYTTYLKDDFALLKLQTPISENEGYKPMSIQPAHPDLVPYTSLWFAGYGVNENQQFTAQLSFNTTYFGGRNYNTESNTWKSWQQPGPVFSNRGTYYGMIYTTDSKPQGLSIDPKTWSFRGPGDEGGPLMSYDQNTGEFSILGLYSRNLYDCPYAGFYASLPYSFAQNTEITESRYTLIQKIISQNVNPADIRCMPNTYFACQRLKTVYVLNQSRNSIGVYGFNSDNSLYKIQEVSTGINPQAFTFDSDDDYMLVANSGTTGHQSSISVFKINPDGSLTPNVPPQQQLPPDSGIPLSIISGRGNKIYTASNNIITKLTLNNDTGILTTSKVINIPNAKIIKIKYIKSMSDNIFAFDTLNNKIFKLTTSFTEYENLTNNLDKPTDLIEKSNSFLITNSGNNQILNYAIPSKSIELTTVHPNQIIRYHSFYYVTNLGSNNITILKFNKDTKQLDLINTVPTGNYPGNMAISESQLYVTNYLDNTLKEYVISPNDGSLILNTTIDAGQQPIAVLVTGGELPYEVF